MNRYVVDATVAVKWFIPEINSEKAARLLDGTYELLAPDLLLPEFGHILWKKVQLGEITQETSRRIIHEFKAMMLQTYPSTLLLETAVEMANTLAQTVNDCFYMALAFTEECQLVTADRKLYNSLKISFFADKLVWVEDISNL
ncbi:MAG: type II toxin-antitoxin system VapC family toxin [Pelatocladus maniniholoensis HA4357-MV3]|uniref:Type II toxin-antitoxin system VapC family toxin n=1 Tax=Pelatocladus maniniholoensis HA4357-MV3 TaxID=1117104 RepID=A0A9E3H6V1_9NOST|nr:type II toxin-antitoxin system VapC family toxin [Pelatocladus maniniholoensis HA4357-MV3]BAZ69337.1 PilT domain-containing protein [Fischerella sp. NIES-4106]